MYVRVPLGHTGSSQQLWNGELTVGRKRAGWGNRDRKSTRLNSSHLVISYAVFCLKKKKKQRNKTVLHIDYESAELNDHISTRDPHSLTIVNRQAPRHTQKKHPPGWDRPLQRSRLR